MELKNFYRLVFTNQQEYFVESEITNTGDFLKGVKDAGLFSGNDYIRLQLKDGDPIFIRSAQLFSVQKAREGVVGAQTKLWRLV